MEQTTYDKDHIEVTQDGIARIMLNTPDNIQGIYTEGLQTCLAIIIVGEQSISVIHATSKLSVESIKNEFKQHQIKFWTIAYNPTHYPEKKEDQNLREHISLFIMGIEEVCSDKHLKNNKGELNLYEAKYGFVSVDRVGNINTDHKPETIFPPSNKKLRHYINQVNNYFLSDNSGDVVAADIQYDGYNFSGPPSLKKSDEEVNDLLETKKFITSDMRLTAIELRDKVKTQLSEMDDIKKIYSLLNVSQKELERGLRKAAANNKYSDIQRFVKLGIDINAVSKKDGKTALHHAVEKGYVDCVKELVKHNAKSDIRDTKFKTAYDYADELENKEIFNLLPNPSSEFKSIQSESITTQQPENNEKKLDTNDWVRFFNSKIVGPEKKKPKNSTRVTADFTQEDINKLKIEFPECKLQ